MMGLFLHDIGKTRELVYDRTFAYHRPWRNSSVTSWTAC